MSKVQLYSDGACQGNPGPGGWGVLLIAGEHRKRLFGGEAHTTNNRMELQAVIEGLKALKRRCEVHVHTDSQYVQKGMTEWLPQWKSRGWKTRDNAPVKNQDLWQILESMVQAHDVHWHWVKGHAGDPGNEEADQLARQGSAAAARGARHP